MLCEPVTNLWWNKNWKSMETPSVLFFFFSFSLRLFILVAAAEIEHLKI